MATNPYVADIVRNMPIPQNSYVDLSASLLTLADDYDLTTKEAVVLAYIYGHSHDGKPHPIPISTAAAWAGYERRAGAASALRKLARLGLIAKGPMMGATNTYVATIRPASAESHFCRIYWWMVADMGLLSLPQIMLYGTVFAFWAIAQGNPEQPGCLWASVDTICEWLRLGHSTVCNGLSALVAQGLITKTTIPSSRGRVCQYRIVPSRLPASVKPAKGKPTDDAEPTERERKLAEIDAETHAKIRQLSAEAARRKWDVDHPDGSDRDYYAHAALRKDIGALAGEIDFLRRHPEMRTKPDWEILAAYEAEQGREARAKKEARKRHGC